jgi:hypothetical protein
MPINPNYNPIDDYDAFDDVTLSDDCGCAEIGLVTLKNCDGDVIGLLTPNDAETYKNGILEIAPGLVKVFHPTTGAYLGALTIEEAQTYLTYLNSL